MGDLANLAGAGRSDVIDGHTLSPLSLKDFGELELAIEARVIALAQIAADGQPHEVAQFILRMAQDDIARGKYSFGKPAFNAAVMSGQRAGHLLFLSLRHANPDITREAAEKIIDGPEGEKARNAVAELSGYQRTEPGGSAQGIDWHGLYDILEKKGVPRAAVGDLTLNQLYAKLGIKGPHPELPTKSNEQKAEERAAIFDAVCVRHELKPAQLAELPPDRVAELLKAEGHTMIADAVSVGGWLREYAARRT